MSLPSLENAILLDNAVRSVYVQLEKDITFNNIIHVVKNVMIIVERYGSLTGAQKRQVAVDVIMIMVDRHGGDYRNELMRLAQFVVPEAIDLIISASKGQLMLNIRREVVENVCCGIA